MSSQASTPEENMTDLEIAKQVAEICETNKAADIFLYDLKQSSLLADFYLICSGSSERQLQALAGYIEKKLKEEKIYTRHTDGSPASKWIVIDYGFLLIHLFTPAMRQYYEIEKLWQDKAEIIYRGGQDEDKPVPVF